MRRAAQRVAILEENQRQDRLRQAVLYRSYDLVTQIIAKTLRLRTNWPKKPQTSHFEIPTSR